LLFNPHATGSNFRGAIDSTKYYFTWFTLLILYSLILITTVTGQISYPV